MSKKILIYGAGGHTRSIIPLLKHNNFKISGIIDETYNANKPEVIIGIKLLGSEGYLTNDHTLVLSVGDNNKRKHLYHKYYEILFKENLIHPTLILENDVIIGQANQIFAKTFINSNTKIGNNNIINSGSILEHECIIGNHNHIAVGTILGGRVRIGNNCFVGAGSVIIDKVSICDNAIIGANSTVINDITLPGTYVGQPVKRTK